MGDVVKAFGLVGLGMLAVPVVVVSAYMQVTFFMAVFGIGG